MATEADLKEKRHTFEVLDRRYGLPPFRQHGQRRTTLMLKVATGSAMDILWSEFTQLAEIPRPYPDSPIR